MALSRSNTGPQNNSFQAEVNDWGNEHVPQSKTGYRTVVSLIFLIPLLMLITMFILVEIYHSGSL